MGVVWFLLLVRVRICGWKETVDLEIPPGFQNAQIARDFGPMNFQTGRIPMDRVMAFSEVLEENFEKIKMFRSVFLCAN